MKRVGILVLALTGAAAGAAELRLEVQGCPPGKLVRVALYGDARGFASDARGESALRRASAEAAGGVAHLTISGLSPGRYVVAAFADLDGDGALDRNLLGMPTEPYGFSRDARSLIGPPGFEQAAFDLGEGGATQTIHLK